MATDTSTMDALLLARADVQNRLNTSAKAAASLDTLAAEIAGLDAVELLQFKRAVFLELIPAYMKPATATNTQTPESMSTEAKADAARLEAAYRALVAIVL